MGCSRACKHPSTTMSSIIRYTNNPRAKVQHCTVQHCPLTPSGVVQTLPRPWLNLRHRSSATLFVRNTESAQALPHFCSGKMFREQVCWIILSRNLTYLQTLILDRRLKPQVTSLQATQLPQASSMYNSSCCRTIRK